MKTLSRILVVAARAFSLVACGDDDDEEDLSARTTACRAYELRVGDADDALANELTTAATEGGADTDTLISQLQEIREVAVHAGSTDELSDKDFKIFLRVTRAVSEVQQHLRETSGSETGDVSLKGVLPFQKAIEVVKNRCA